MCAYLPIQTHVIVTDFRYRYKKNVSTAPLLRPRMVPSSLFQQMTEHYMKHVIKEGQKSAAKNIVNYTKQAKAFFANNSTSGYLLRKGVIKIDGAPGGIFNTDGLIRSFWYVRLQMLGGLL